MYNNLPARSPVKISEMRVKCPACGRETLVLEDYLYDVPHVGKVILTSGKCSYCGYRFTDVRLAEPRSPRRLVFKIQRPEDLNVLIVKASTASIKIPELGLELKPGPAAEGFITTIEGVLRRFMDVLEFLCRSGEDVDKEKCNLKKRELSEALEGRRGFTLILEDPEGVSTIVASNVVEEPLNSGGSS